MQLFKQQFLKLIAFVALAIFAFSPGSDSFKNEQLRYSRVRQAYADKENSMQNLLSEVAINRNQLEIYLRAFKHEKELELWGKNKSTGTFKLIKKYSICESSGTIGPKRKQGDYQVPEGYYHINIFNPFSTFYLSLGVNYPNKSDKILGVKNKLGGDIYIHGSCVTIGCLPITDDQIKELYIFCVEARNNGQQKIPITFFPARLSNEMFDLLKKEFGEEIDKINLWTDLKKGYDFFNTHKKLPAIQFLPNGRHQVEQ